jgi:hypothetical protein
MWNYSSEYLPEELHTDIGEWEQCRAWLTSARIYKNSEGQYAGRLAGESVSLVIGRIIHDIFKGMFSQNDLDEEPDPSIPEFIHESLLNFTLIDTTLEPLCLDVINCIRGQTEHPSPIATQAQVTSTNPGIEGSEVNTREASPRRSGRKHVPSKRLQESSQPNPGSRSGNKSGKKQQKN